MIAKIARPEFLRKENIYGVAPAIFALTYMLVAPYLFPPEWVITAQAQDFVTRVASLAPVLHDMQQAPQYTPYWGVFYAVFLTVSLVFYVVGFSAPYYLKSDSYKKKFASVTFGQMLLALAFVSPFVWAIYRYPLFWSWAVMSEKGTPSIKMFFSLYATSAICYMAGGCVGVVFKKAINLLARSK